MHRVIKKAIKSICNHRVAAMALDKQDNIIGIASNRPRFMHRGGGLHAEMVLMRRYSHRVHKILITRVNKSGQLLPIDPCPACLAVAESLGIRILRWKS